mgnify:CR=1 FL=1
MNEILKYLGDVLRRTYGVIVEKPMPWRMIDKLATLEEVEEREAKGQAEQAPPKPDERTTPPRDQQTD